MDNKEKEPIHCKKCAKCSKMITSSMIHSAESAVLHNQSSILFCYH